MSNLSRGFRRIGWVFLGIVWAVALAVGVQESPGHQRDIFLGMLAFTAVCVALYLAVAWIVRGFGKT